MKKTNRNFIDDFSKLVDKNGGSLKKELLIKITLKNTVTKRRYSTIFSQIFFGLFLFLIFYFRDNRLDNSTVYIIFGVFIVSSISGMILLMSLRSADTGSLQYAPRISTITYTPQPKYDHIKVMSRPLNII